MTRQVVPKGSPIGVRLLARININPLTGCWEWTLGRNNVGYGTISRGRRGEGNALVHRVAWQVWKGPIPEGMTLDHLCRVRHCCNPEHLEPVTLRENNRRGNSWAGINARKTHCKNGHEFTPENTHVKADGSRHCRACHAAVVRKRNQELRRAELSP